ncbi:BglG family transcription antiterminator [Paenibacillus sedimenti]|uniref:BglG family transcription antiterminator n=1 Tax=Paenibacillus sedimenti TaxID=2770274 RepID=A0A926KSQ9_9BACL|nr:BglG family transcription antiterminator [Paenibacillus sedimenti]MBD0381335.1 BglG family transcription antiterminator [Paenibacillus sedimenti]
MKRQGMTFNSRQHQILSLLLHASAPVTLKEISDNLKISIRTIQREIDGLDVRLNQQGLTLSKKSGVGLSIEGTDIARRDFLNQLSVNLSTKIFSPEERQYLLMQMMLSLKEPTKLFYFSSKLEVTEATISNDLDKIEPWFDKHQIKLVRKPGLGVFIEGNETSIRAAIVDLLYKHFSQEQLMEILNSYTFAFSDKFKLELSIHNHLLHFVEPTTISHIENVIKQTEKLHGYEMTDSAYVGFVVHIALAIQRLKSGENISINPDALQKLKETDEFIWALQIAEELSAAVEVGIPESEVGYITMHLLGAQGKRNITLSDKKAYPDIDYYVYPMIRIVEKELKLELEQDQSLIESLSTHLESAIQRLLFNMDIRNPLLNRIRQEYPDVYNATVKAARYLEDQLNCKVPEEEIGYLAMHFGAALVRKRIRPSASYRVLLACASGMGTSRLLGAQIEKNFPHIKIVDTVSILKLEEWTQKKRPIDLIISTVPFQHDDYKVIVVNSFLYEADIELIEGYLQTMPMSSGAAPIETVEIEETVMAVNRYGEAIMIIMEHIYLAEHVQVTTKEDMIRKASVFVGSHLSNSDTIRLQEELTKREQLGGLVLEEDRLAMLHCRSEAIDSLCVCLFLLEQDIDWWVTDHAAQVKAVLLLLAPRTSPKEHIEMVSEISAELIEDEFVQTLLSGESGEVRKRIKALLSRSYMQKVSAEFRGRL